MVTNKAPSERAQHISKPLSRVRQPKEIWREFIERATTKRSRHCRGRSATDLLGNAAQYLGRSHRRAVQCQSTPGLQPWQSQPFHHDGYWLHRGLCVADGWPGEPDIESHRLAEFAGQGRHGFALPGHTLQQLQLFPRTMQVLTTLHNAKIYVALKMIG